MADDSLRRRLARAPIPCGNRLQAMAINCRPIRISGNSSSLHPKASARTTRSLNGYSISISQKGPDAAQPSRSLTSRRRGDLCITDCQGTRWVHGPRDYEATVRTLVNIAYRRNHIFSTVVLRLVPSCFLLSKLPEDMCEASELMAPSATPRFIGQSIRRISVTS